MPSYKTFQCSALATEKKNTENKNKTLKREKESD